MTAVAALVAEAIQLARESTPPLVNECARVTYRGTDSAWAWYTRDDVRDAALTHLATRAAEAEGRAERAERTSGLLQRRVNALVAALERLTRDWKFKKNTGGHRGFAARALGFDARRFAGTLTPGELAEEASDAAGAEDAEKEAGRG